MAELLFFPPCFSLPLPLPHANAQQGVRCDLRFLGQQARGLRKGGGLRRLDGTHVCHSQRRDDAYMTTLRSILTDIGF